MSWTCADGLTPHRTIDDDAEDARRTHIDALLHAARTEAGRYQA